MDKNDALTCFDALSQETRLDVVRLLIRSAPEGLPAGEIGERLGIRQNTMSSHLKVLAQARLITAVREGRIIRYHADFSAVRGLIVFLMEDCCGGNPELCQPVLDKVKCGC
ncbi:ArsR/SmtB family transcription factor [Asticcacaulis solisilvae]|uniref:ArsR/SmtB family transcription factor n=1 Tax=Asticcacaulis solisilvae TaxID=1217274 RepID=UPI003FD8403C